MRKNTRANLHSLVALMAMAALLLAAQCNPGPEPAPPGPLPVVDGGPPPPAPSDDKCSQTLDLVRMEGCTLPNDWLDACRTARAHGATFHLVCFQKATDCNAVRACMNETG